MGYRKQRIDGWYSPRGYLHFDRPVSYRFAKSFLDSPERVAQHSFFPFVAYKKCVPRYRPKEGRVEDKIRPIAYASHLDSHIYARYSQILSESLEQHYQNESLGASVLAYRSIGKCNIDFANDVFDDVVARTPCVALAFDVSGFFDTLDHALLKKRWCELLGLQSLPPDHYAVYKSITRFSHASREKVYAEFGLNPNSPSGHSDRICSPMEFRTRVRGKGIVTINKKLFGIPQGSPISAVLSNTYMLPFDREMSCLAKELGGAYRRYSDDILWLCPPEQEQRVTDCVYSQLEQLKLKANSEKTERSVFSKSVDGQVIADRPLQYLGFTFDGARKLIRPQTLARYYRRMKTSVRAAAKAAARADSDTIYRRDLYRRFSHLGRRNFVNYGRRSQRILESEAIRRQLVPHWQKLHAELKKGLSRLR